MLTNVYYQWYAEVLHFCRDVPILLVGCKKDLRYDQKTIEELRKTSQKPVSPEEVRIFSVLRLVYDYLLTRWMTGRGSQEEDQRAQVPGVLGQDQRRCARGV